MKFRDIINPNDEMLSGVSVSQLGDGCSLSWTYPFRCKKICVFEVPFDKDFRENEANDGKFTKHVLAHPDTTLNVAKPCNFAVFCVDDDDVLIRQSNTLISCPINVRYKIVTETNTQTIKGRFGFTKKKLTEEHKYLDIVSDISISGSEVLYRIDNGLFCIPCDLPANTTVRLAIKQEPKLFARKKAIQLIKQKG